MSKRKTGSKRKPAAPHQNPAEPKPFPLLTKDNHRQTSPFDAGYNCIAWAAGESGRWWWPDGLNFWPAGAPRLATIDAFTRAYGSLGYTVCADSSPEKGVEKVAIYAKNGVPTH